MYFIQNHIFQNNIGLSPKYLTLYPAFEGYLDG